MVGTYGEYKIIPNYILKTQQVRYLRHNAECVIALPRHN